MNIRNGGQYTYPHSVADHINGVLIQPLKFGHGKRDLSVLIQLKGLNKNLLDLLE